MKKCPYCAEEIQDEAIKCRFCGEFLKKKKKWINCISGCLIVFTVLILSFILFIYLSIAFTKFIIYKIFFSGPNLPHYSPPFFGQGIEKMLRDFAEVFRALWDKFKDFLHIGPHGYKITF